ncbi:hypothetical protein PC118_g7455 [Phytophthora cactorum]|uniref:Uncharacterized protein n=2 Tax=Phytophthora cactorum TaxID=29920 RepID=A0A8T1E054_9STRA|nr:hypothetical protein PC117_g7788 [Phytophthora cactorum]KAG2987127.1 hypothetical protein PC118_g7455 [Phytophthora cactorum]KAG3035533.1 hypothetical protein PC119_g4551 [Phytophthora cactorum]KAG3089785.1 hypothetical protein PC122_g7724 [Phytophthora cactorum]
MRTEFGEVVQADACVVDGCTCEFLLGVDLMREHEANMDFNKNELCCAENGPMVVVPFRIFDKETGAKVATDGKKGVFIPTKQFESGMLAATMTDVRNGKAWERAINAGRDRVKLPSKKELGTWIPLDEEMELGNVNTPLENEEEVHIGTTDEDGRNSPPPTALDVEHHIDTGNAAPIMLKRRRQAQSEDAVVDDNVNKMLATGAIEEGNGA